MGRSLLIVPLVPGPLITLVPGLPGGICAWSQKPDMLQRLDSKTSLILAFRGRWQMRNPVDRFRSMSRTKIFGRVRGPRDQRTLRDGYFFSERLFVVWSKIFNMSQFGNVVIICHNMLGQSVEPRGCQLPER